MHEGDHSILEDDHEHAHAHKRRRADPVRLVAGIIVAAAVVGFLAWRLL
jgi:type VI protein secretion system component VasF